MSVGSRPEKRKFSWATFAMLALFIVVTAVTLLPFVSILLASFRPGNEIMRRGLIWAGEGKQYAIDNGLTTEPFANTAKMY